MPTFGVSIYSISRKILSGEMTPESAVTWLCENGAQCIELVPFGIDMISDPNLASRLVSAAKAGGVPIENYSLNANFLLLTDEEHAAEVARVKSHIDIAHALGVPTMRVDCASFRRPMEKNTLKMFLQEFDSIVTTYQALYAYAQTQNVQLLLENHGFHINGSDRVAALLEVIGPSLGHQLDVGNFICVDEDPCVATLKMLPYATTVHLKDFYIRPEDRNPGDATQFDCSGSWFKSWGGSYLRGSILGQGDLDIRRILKTLKHGGFNGNIFIEYEGMEDCFYGTHVSLLNAKRIWDEV